MDSIYGCNLLLPLLFPSSVFFLPPSLPSHHTHTHKLEVHEHQEVSGKAQWKELEEEEEEEEVIEESASEEEESEEDSVED